MDQVKVILKQVVKYHFWILCLVVIIASITGWYMASKALTAVYNQQKSTITGKFTALTRIESEPNPPNATWKDAVTELTTEQKQSVSIAWTKVYDEQKSVLKWPADILGEDFVKAVESHAPDWDIDYDSKNVYFRKIREEFPKLLKIVDAASAQEAKAAQEKNSDVGGEHSIVWDSGSQRTVQESVEWKQVPSSTEIRRAQEDLWVYEALLQIIAKVNGGRTYGPRIKQLVKMEIGKPATAAFADGLKRGHISEVQAAGTGAASPGGDAPALLSSRQPTRAPADRQAPAATTAATSMPTAKRNPAPRPRSNRTSACRSFSAWSWINASCPIC